MFFLGAASTGRVVIIVWHAGPSGLCPHGFQETFPINTLRPGIHLRLHRFICINAVSYAPRGLAFPLPLFVNLFPHCFSCQLFRGVRPAAWRESGHTFQLHRTRKVYPTVEEPTIFNDGRDAEARGRQEQVLHNPPAPSESSLRGLTRPYFADNRK